MGTPTPTAHWVAHVLAAILLILTVVGLGFQRQRLLEAANNAEVARRTAETLVAEVGHRAAQREWTLSASVAAAQIEVERLSRVVATKTERVRRPWRPTSAPSTAVEAAERLTAAVTSTAVQALSGVHSFAASARLLEGQQLVTTTATEAALLTDLVERLPAAANALDAAVQLHETQKSISASFLLAYRECQQDNTMLTGRLSKIAQGAAGIPNDGDSGSGFFSTTITVGGIAVGVSTVAIFGAIAYGASR